MQAPDSHVVAVRITSEDAAAGFKPTAGRIDELHFRPTPEVQARLAEWMACMCVIAVLCCDLLFACMCVIVMLCCDLYHNICL